MTHLGPFVLEAPIAAGGMAEVWRARRDGTEPAFAVKVLRGVHATAAEVSRAFRAEVRAVASLAHPGIIQVHDYGTVPDGVDGLAAGQPYLVMDLVDGGTLQGIRLPWRETRRVLTEVLEALGHAHAWGVVHCDLKPANLLVDRARQRVVLTDFGIALAMGRRDGAGARVVAGTPAYMAPEQFRGVPLELGPWTDLYAAGCLAWQLLTGEPPFGRLLWREARRAHTSHPLPVFRPRVAIPDGLEAWLARLLDKHPQARFQWAADAQRALAHLEDPSPTALPPIPFLDDATPEPGPRTAETVLVEPTTLLTGSGHATEEVPHSHEAQPALHDPAPELPDWRRPPDARPAAAPGLGLLGLRRLPLIGRSVERDTLWRALREVLEGRMPRVVALHGEPGTGKSCLAEWLAGRASEVGAARVFHGVWSDPPGPGDGLGPMMARALRVAHVERIDAADHIQRVLAAHGVRDSETALALTELCHPLPDDDVHTRTIRLQGESERLALVQRVLTALAANRVALVWLDEAHRSSEGLALASQLARSRCPALVVTTSRGEAVGLGGADVVRLRIPPLDEAEHAELVTQLLPLDPALVHRVYQRSAGYPLFTVQLVTEWAERGLLRPGPRGHLLVDEAPGELPRDLAHLWRERLDQVAGIDTDARHALELAATLGVDIDPQEWQEACAQAFVDIADDLLERLVRGRLVRVSSDERGGDRSWSLISVQLREALVQQARAAGRWVDANRVCAGVVRGPQAAGRRGRHLLAADEPDQAADALLDGVEAQLATGAVGDAVELLDRVDEALSRAAAPADDPRRGTALTLRARVLADLGDGAASLEHALAALELAERHGWPDQQGQASLRVGEVYRERPDVDRAIRWFTRARQAFEQAGRASQAALATLELARCETFRGNFAAARALNAEAHTAFARLDDALGCANCQRHRAELLLRDGNELARARTLFRQARNDYHRMGMRFGVASCDNGLAEIARLLGDLEAAEEGYRRAADTLDALGHGGSDIMRINLCLCGLQRGDHLGQRDALTALRGRLADQERWGLAGCLDAFALPGDVMAEDWEAFDRHLDDARTHLEAASVVDHDVAALAAEASQLARAKGQSRRAAGAAALAAAQRHALEGS